MQKGNKTPWNPFKVKVKSLHNNSTHSYSHGLMVQTHCSLTKTENCSSHWDLTQLLTFLSLWSNRTSGGTLSFPTFLVGPVFLFLFAGAARVVGSALDPPSTGLSRASAAAGHFQPLSADWPSVARLTPAAAAGVWFWAVSLPTRSSYLGDVLGQNTPRTESGGAAVDHSGEERL